MFKTERLQIKNEIAIGNLPSLREIEKLPGPSAFRTPVIMTVRSFPSDMCFLSLPDDLGIRPDQEIVSPSFKLFSF